MIKKIVLMATLGLAACTAGPSSQTGVVIPPGPAITPVQTDTCNAAQMQAYLGRPSTSLETKLLIQPVRLIRPGDAITEDLLPTRINFYLDGDDHIRRIICG